MPGVWSGMLRSMTGFGRGRVSEGRHTITVEARSVNHRYAEVRVSGPVNAALNSEIEAEVRRRFTRGRVEVAITTQSEGGSAPVLDSARAKVYRDAFVRLAQELELPQTVSVELILAQPGVIVAGATDSPIQSEALVRPALASALDALEQMRQREGDALGALMHRHLEAARVLWEQVAVEVPRAIGEKKQRLEQRISVLLGSNPEPARIAQEVALLVDRTDITEELERLRSHFVQMTAILEGKEPAGRKLDFLIQEMNREANTIGSKSADATVAHLVVSLKAELERMREQVQNLE